MARITLQRCARTGLIRGNPCGESDAGMSLPGASQAHGQSRRANAPETRRRWLGSGRTGAGPSLRHRCGNSCGGGRRAAPAYRPGAT